MAETDDKQNKRPDKAASSSEQQPAGGDKPVRADKADKAERAEKAGKGEKGDKAAKGAKPDKAEAPRELRAKNHMKIISLAPEVL